LTVFPSQCEGVAGSWSVEGRPAVVEYARLRHLSDASDEPERGLRAVAERLGDFEPGGVVQVRLVDGGEGAVWSIVAGGGDARAGEAARPDLEIVTTEPTWGRLAEGSYSPLQAFLDGSLRVRGDVALGKRMLRHLGEPGGTVDVC
jgi:hypothetical protein